MKYGGFDQGRRQQGLGSLGGLCAGAGSLSSRSGRVVLCYFRAPSIRMWHAKGSAFRFGSANKQHETLETGGLGGQVLSRLVRGREDDQLGIDGIPTDTTYLLNGRH